MEFMYADEERQSFIYANTYSLLYIMNIKCCINKQPLLIAASIDRFESYVLIVVVSAPSGYGVQVEVWKGSIEQFYQHEQQEVTLDTGKVASVIDEIVRVAHCEYRDKNPHVTMDYIVEEIFQRICPTDYEELRDKQCQQFEERVKYRKYFK